MWEILDVPCLAILEKPRALLRFANYSLLACAFFFLVSILLCYPFAAMFSLAVQVIAHIFLIASAVGIKLTYLLRCVAQKELHMEVG